MIKKPPGIEDIFPDRIDLWDHITRAARETFALHNYREIIIPIMEYTEVFARGIGDETDIVSKEMFSFEDRGGRDLTLRPEGTASVVRAYVENGEYNRLATCKLFYTGPMFRAEKPQKGRLRQFNQFGAEFFGSGDPYYDYEIISMVNAIAETSGVKNFRLLINSIGCPACRPEYIAALKEYYRDKKEQLCDDCKKRLEKNTLRLLDCKAEGCSSLKNDAPVITSFLCGHCSDHHHTLKQHLGNSGINYIEDTLLVRGLDYYTRTTFEFVSDDLGSQSAFAAGGRYDNLVEVFDGRPTPAVGFAAGIERLMLLLENAPVKKKGLDAYVIHSGGETMAEAVRTVSRLRSEGISADMDPEGKNFKNQMKKADRERARYAVIIGESELASESVTVKDMSTGDQKLVERDRVQGFILPRSG